MKWILKTKSNFTEKSCLLPKSNYYHRFHLDPINILIKFHTDITQMGDTKQRSSPNLVPKGSRQTTSKISNIKKAAGCHLRDPTLPPIRTKRKSVLSKTAKRVMTSTPAYREHHHFSRSNTRFEVPSQQDTHVNDTVQIANDVEDDETFPNDHNEVENEEYNTNADVVVTDSKPVFLQQAKVERMVEKRLNNMRIKAIQHRNKSFDNVIALPP